ncbi:MAG: chorismate synthase [Pseudomonadota bacterium]|nr:chorismate synthase [Pseudomonadota bacterium]
MSSQFGDIFRISTFGESHGKSVGVVIDGCPPNIKIDWARVQHWLDRRRPGQSALTSTRQEADKVACYAGIEDGITLGTPIMLAVRNCDQRPSDYRNDILRPSHADYSYLAKYGLKPSSGGGRASARETVSRVAAAAIAERVIATIAPALEIIAWVDSVSDLQCNFTAEQRRKITPADIEANSIRCPDDSLAIEMQELITTAKDTGDTVGGCLAVSIRNCPAGLGEPVFDKLEAKLAHAMLSIPATKGFEIGSGFAGTKMSGSQHNDPYRSQNGKVITTSNNSGGVQGGISNGEEIFMRIACKPVSTVFKEQTTITTDRKPVKYTPKGRHDPCVLPRAVVVAEAMATLVIVDLLLQHKTRQLAN